MHLREIIDNRVNCLAFLFQQDRIGKVAIVAGKSLQKSFRVACYHALALDERRADFPVMRWQNNDDPKLTERWFAGVHSDVGGGNLVADIFDKRRNGRQIAHVSYKGKVWKGADGLDGKPLYAPPKQKPVPQ